MADVEHCSVSLFSGGGFGDIGIEFGTGTPIIACCELLPERANLLKTLFPNAAVHVGDIWDARDAIVESVHARLNDKRPWLLSMSPPCQGMSSNGAGRITTAVAQGKRPEMDPRNRLVLPALDIVNALRPEWVVIENVKNMRRTVIMNEDDQLENVIALIRRKLGDYDVQTRVIDAADYGIPQRRERLITICRRKHGSVLLSTDYHPPASHGTSIPHVTFDRATRHLSPLDAISHLQDPDDVLHRIPKWTRAQYFCMQHTPEGQTAFHNTKCVECGFENPELLRLDCDRCGRQLAKPVMTTKCWWCLDCGEFVPQTRARCAKLHERKGDVYSQTRLIRAFKTAYRRMNGNQPCATLTTNSGVISSDVKGHPREHRVLSTREVLIVASVSSYPGFDAPWNVEATMRDLPDRLIRHVAGESIPPLMLCTLVRHLRSIPHVCRTNQA